MPAEHQRPHRPSRPARHLPHTYLVETQDLARTTGALHLSDVAERTLGAELARVSDHHLP
jgi:hypothetical protein